jgi:hypothetical protein
MFFQNKNCDRWELIQQNTNSVPAIQTSKLVKERQLHVSVKFCTIQNYELKCVFLPNKNCDGLGGIL